MFETFLTVISIICLVSYIFSVGLLFYTFLKLPPLQQEIATVNVNSTFTISAILSIAWLITKALS